MARPHRPILSRELIIATALDLIDRTGRFTLPELAQRLGVSVSSLYHHIEGRASIVEGIRGLLAATMTPPTEPDWQDAVVHWATSYRDAFAAHPAAIPQQSRLRDAGTDDLRDPPAPSSARGRSGGRA